MLSHIKWLCLFLWWCQEEFSLAVWFLHCDKISKYMCRVQFVTVTSSVDHSHFHSVAIIYFRHIPRYTSLGTLRIILKREISRCKCSALATSCYVLMILQCLSCYKTRTSSCKDNSESKPRPSYSDILVFRHTSSWLHLIFCHPQFVLFSFYLLVICSKYYMACPS